MRKAKIVSTLGPATNTPEKIRELIMAGMDVARINRSHGTAEEHAVTIDMIRKASDEIGKAVAILVDLQGPKIRLGNFVNGKEDLSVGDIFTITTRDVEGTKEEVGTTYGGLPGDCRPGDRLLIDDGKVEVQVIKVSGTDVTTKVTVPGAVSNHKGLNLPGVAVSVPALSEKDKEDLRWAMDIDADFIALSFVRSSEDINDVHAIMDEFGRRKPVIAKIEKPQAVENLEEIAASFDGLMVARGDLGVELPLEQVPLVQKRAITLARRRAKPVIVATQVLESMIENPRPTRAEASDCANAILDGADAVMLSGETSVGAYPIVAVQTMARIIQRVESEGHAEIAPLGLVPHTTGGAVARSAVEMADLLNTNWIVTFTMSGDAARRVSRLRPDRDIIACTPSPQTRRQLALTWGVTTYNTEYVEHSDELVQQVDQVLLSNKIAKLNERVIVVAGMPPGRIGSTNSIRVHRVGINSEI